MTTRSPSAGPKGRCSARRATVLGAGALTLGAALAGVPQIGQAAVIAGSGGHDVTVGRDDDNAANRFIQPAGVAAKQHMDNTDVHLGKAGDDLLIGQLGGDTLLGEAGHDILVGGPENFQAPNSDVLVGADGNDINIWAPGDGSDAFVGGAHSDTMVFAPFVTHPDGSLKLATFGNRVIPRVDIGGQAAFSCTIVPVPAAQKLGAQFLVRFNVNNVPAVTVRQTDVERVYCPSPNEGKARVADLTAAHPSFSEVSLAQVPGVLGAILAQP